LALIVSVSFAECRPKYGIFYEKWKISVPKSQVNNKKLRCKGGLDMHCA